MRSTAPHETVYLILNCSTDSANSKPDGGVNEKQPGDKRRWALIRDTWRCVTHHTVCRPGSPLLDDLDDVIANAE